uniref:TIL domain-containing protein n=1 Tax=Ciona savignyi TaxID=51511 RepID=H2ZEK3_CIOSA
MRYLIALTIAVCCASQANARYVVCQNGQPPANCLVDPCYRARCPGVPDATCTADYCSGSCDFAFYHNWVKLTRRQCIVDICPMIVQPPCSHTDDTICATTSCPNHPTAVCRKNCYCRASFHDHVTLLPYSDCDKSHQ